MNNILNLYPSLEYKKDMYLLVCKLKIVPRYVCAIKIYTYEKEFMDKFNTYSFLRDWEDKEL